MVALPSLGDISAILPSTNDILQQVALSAASGVIIAGIKNQAGNGALDPLGLFNHPAPAAPVAAPVAIAPTVIPHTAVAASVWATLSPADKAMLTASGVSIVAG